MKKSLLYILAVLVGPLLFGACDKHDSASAPNSYSEFFINPPSFNTPSGSKVYWDDDGLWWSPTGDLVLINGTQYQIIKGTDPNTGATQWKTYGGLQTDKVNDHFYCCYIGQDLLTPIFDTNENGRYLYKDVDLENIVPLVGESRDNLMTLKPCCAVLKIINLDRQIVITFPPTVKFYYNGDLNVTQALLQNPSGDGKNQFRVNRPANNTAYVILPMTSDLLAVGGQITIAYKDDDRQTQTRTTRESGVSIKKGYIYVIDFAQLQGN